MDYSTIIQTPTFRAVVQENALEKQFYDGLYPKQLFRSEADNERWESNVGDNKTFTGKGLMPVNLVPLIPGQDPVPGDYRLEQWTAMQSQWSGTVDTHLPTSLAACVKKLLEDVKQLGLNAGQSLNRICRYKLFNAGDSGWTVSDGSQSAVTSLRVKRLNGFTRARRPDLTTGSPVRFDFVTANNPLPITYVHSASTLAVNVIGFTPDTPGDEIGPGLLLLDAAATTTDRDPVMASTRTFRVISGGGNASDALSAGTDILHLSDIRSAVARMRKTDVMEMSDGTFHFHVDPIGEGQLFSDVEVQRLNVGIPEGEMYRDFAIGRLMGCTFYRNNECPDSGNVFGGSSATFSPRDPVAGELYANGVTSGAPVHRAIAIGMEAMKEYYVDQNAMMTEAGVTGRVQNGATITANGVETNVERIRMIMRAPLDRLQQNVANTWSFQGDFVVRTDGATGDAAAYKRAVAVLFTE